MRRLPVLLGLWLCSCASGLHVTQKEPSQKLELIAAFVYPLAFRWEEPAYRSFEVSQRLIDVAVQEGGARLSFYGPTEFKVMRDRDDGAWVATTALPLLTTQGARPEQGVVIRPWAEKRVSSSTQEAEDAKGRRAGASADADTLYVGHVEVVHPSTQEVLLDVSGEVRVDPFAVAPPEADYDPAPQLTALMEKLVREAVKRLGRFTGDRTVQDLPGIVFALTPQASLRWQDGARPSAELDMAKMDSASLDLFVQARARMLNPRLSDAQAAKLAKLPPGLYVVGGAPAGGSLEEGDVVVTIEESPGQPQVWARLRFAPVAQARVRKPSGEMVDVMLP